MKKRNSWKIRAGAFCLTAVCLGTGAALAAEAGGEGDPLVTLSYLNETVLPKLVQDTEDRADQRQAELTAQFSQAVQGGGGGSGASYTVVTLNAGQRMDLDLGAEVLLRVGSAAAGAAVNPALVDVTAGGNLNSGEWLVQNHLYLATMTDHYITAGGSTVKVLIRGGYPEEVAEAALCYVKSFGYVNDLEYARSFILGRKSRKSAKEMQAALREKGVSWEIIEEAMEECCDGDAAQEAIRELLRKRRYDPDTASPEETRKTLAYLMRKGFRYDDVRQVIQVSEWNA